MNTLGLIIQREYKETVKTKAFLLTTILTPLALILVFVLPVYLKSLKDTDISTVYVKDNTGKYTALFKSSDTYKFENIYNQNLKGGKGEKTALLEINKDLVKDPSAATFFSEKQKPPAELVQYINDVLTEAVKSENLELFTQTANIDGQTVADLQQILNSKDKIKINTLRWNDQGEATDTLNEAASIIGMLFTFIMFFFIVMYGSMVMQSITEEKTNRIVEVIVSSTKPFNLMMGKIIAVGLSGLTQLAIWSVIITIVSLIAIPLLGVNGSEMAAAQMQNTEMISAMNSQMTTIIVGINWLKICAFFIIYFIGGYLLYASLFAMFGAAANDSQEAQQFVMPITVILMLAFYLGFAATSNPEGTLAFWGSIIPFTSPVVMMVRTPYEVPWWEMIISVILLFITAIMMTKLASKIYRTGILMHGKKTSFKELGKWLRYK